MVQIEQSDIVAADGHELIRHGNELFPVACYYDDLKEGTVPWHWHEEFEAVLVTQGTAIFQTDTKALVLNEGEGCVVNSRVLHAAINYGGCACRIQSILFHPKLIGGYHGSIYWQEYLYPIINHSAFSILPLRESGDENWAACCIRSSMRDCLYHETGYELEVRNKLSSLCGALKKLLPRDVAPLPASVLRNEERVRTMLDYIRTHLSEPLRIKDIAHAASVSRTECTRCFRETLGESPNRYVRQFRLQRAAELLDQTGKKIRDIGAECGFYDMSYFSKLFYEQFGMQPSAYRAMRRTHRDDTSEQIL